MKRLSQLLRDAWWLTKPYFSSEDRWTAIGLIALLVGLNLGMVYLNVVLNEWRNVFYNALQEKDWSTFVHQMIRFSWLAALYIAAAVYQLYLNQMLQIRWRQWLTRGYLDAWLDKRAYYRMQLANGAADNPDQRISDDLRLFVEQTLRLSLGLLSAVVNLAAFLGILWSLSGSQSFTLFGHEFYVPGYMVWVALAYAAIGTWLTNMIGRKLIGLNFNQQRYEADFRFGMVRVRENADAIALDGGEASEKRGLLQRFGAVAENWWALMRAQKQLNWFTNGYSQAAVVFPYVVASPAYFFGSMQLGYVMQTASAFLQVQDSLSFIINSYPDIAQWAAVIDRLSQFRTNAEASNKGALAGTGIAIVPSDRQVVALDGLTLDLPNAAPLLVSEHLELVPGKPALITGPSGSGKSTLFRAIAGIWPFGSGVVHVPKGARLMFLPQRPYLPVGTLRAVLIYPSAPADLSDERLREVLKLCSLPDLEARLDESRHWALSLSPGEQQRVAFARALLQKPDWLFVDEATASLDEATERDLYRTLAAQLPHTTVVSVGHRSTLRAFHQELLTIERAPGAGRGHLVKADAAPGMATVGGIA